MTTTAAQPNHSNLSELIDWVIEGVDRGILSSTEGFYEIAQARERQGKKSSVKHASEKNHANHATETHDHVVMHHATDTNGLRLKKDGTPMKRPGRKPKNEVAATENGQAS